MPRYVYQAKSLEGEPISGKTEAKDERDLAHILKTKGYILISAIEVGKTKTKKSRISLFGKVPLSEKLMVTRNLQVMIAAGISLPRALRTLSKQAKNKRLKKALFAMADDITKGESFSEVISKHPKIFSELFRSMIKVGEETGGLEKSLGVLAFHIERSHKLRSKVKGALIYPAIVVGAMLIIGVIMVIKVIPQLSEAFEDLEMELPAMTKIIMNMGNYMAAHWYIVVLIFILVPAGLIFASKREGGKRKIDKILLKLPVFSKLITKLNTAYAARTLSSLISGGVSIVEALKITSTTVGNYYFKNSLLKSAEEVKKGKKLSVIIEDYSTIYTPVFIQMLQVGEETGQTSEILAKLSEFLEEEVTNSAQNLSSIIEPILLLLIGGAIGFFAVSMIQPIYSMMGSM